MRDALPDRYLVDRRGTPDPEKSRYYVLDVVHDMHAREILWILVRKFRFNGPSSKADELEQLLKDSEEAFADVIRARQANLQPKAKGRRR